MNRVLSHPIARRLATNFTQTHVLVTAVAFVGHPVYDVPQGSDSLGQEAHLGNYHRR